MKRRLLTNFFVLGAIASLSTCNMAQAHAPYVGKHQPYTNSGNTQQIKSTLSKISRTSPQNVTVGTRVIYTYRDVGTSQDQYSIETAPPIQPYYNNCGYNNCSNCCW